MVLKGENSETTEDISGIASSFMMFLVRLQGEEEMTGEKDTICAIATGSGNAGIGIVRLSGPSAIDIADRLFYGKKKLRELKSYTAAYGHLYSPEDTAAAEAEKPSGEPLDEVIALVMRAPHTYTTEDVVELSCHGGALVMRRVQEELLSAGARLAEPGEFTKRAFLGGRIDLSEAEAVMDVIAAENARALDASLRQLQGGLSRNVTELREKLLYETAYIESALDDPENYSLDGYAEHLTPVLKDCKKKLLEMLGTAREGRLLREGIRTAIVGRPNAGKSSVLNLLLGEERAIVTEIAGTTRDTLEEKTVLGGVQLVLVDTAGIRETEDVVEQIGVQRAREALRSAELILFVIDAAEPLSEADREMLLKLTDPESGEKTDTASPLIVLLNKNDLMTQVTPETVREILEGKKAPGEVRILEISAATGEGKERLSDAVQELFFAGQLLENGENYLLNTRHVEALKDAEEALGRVEESLAAGVGEDFYTIDLLAAYEALGRIIGETLEDDLADKIFREFCMGK